jgi:hypothetical protein
MAMEKKKEMGAKSRRNERGYDLKRLWIGSSEGKDTHYPVPDNFTASKRAR